MTHCMEMGSTLSKEEEIESLQQLKESWKKATSAALDSLKRERDRKRVPVFTGGISET